MRFFIVLLIVFGLYRITEAAIPFGATHTLSLECHWRPDPVWGSLGASKAASDRENGLREACLMRRGLFGRSENVRVILRRFPKPGELP